MKRIAILVIAATDQPVYLHYIRTYWSELIRRTQKQRPHIDVYLLFEHTTDLGEFKALEQNIIVDHGTDYKRLCDQAYHNPTIPGILSKTIFALEHLMGRYDIYFRTNLSSVINLPRLEALIHTRSRIGYSGALAWVDDLRRDLLVHQRIGANRSIKTLTELDNYPGNTFFSGSGYFLSAEEARHLVEHREQLRYDLPDDVAVGLMLPEYEVLHGFTRIMTPDQSVAEIVELIQRRDAGHIRLQWFPLAHAQALWTELPRCDIW